MWVILKPAFIASCDYNFNFFFQFNILHGLHKNAIEEMSGDIKEGTKSQNSKDRLIYELRAEVRYWIKSIILKHI